MKPPLLRFLPIAGALLAGPVAAQQFVQRSGVFPGPPLWSESIAVVDANGDGLLDLFIANAQGYAIPGDFGAPSSDPLPPQLLIHQGVVGGLPTFQDLTATLLPAGLVMHAKQAVSCDVDGDGREDLVIATAFGTRQRLLRRNPSGPGYLDESFRLGNLVLNSFGVGWGDLDDDGDVDLVFSDAGPVSFGGSGGKARLLINDGTGNFTEEPQKLGAINKVGAQNAKILDIDNDLDLDIVVDGKSSVTQVYLNDGEANFTLDTTIVPIAAAVPGAGAYETEWGDLDGDHDLDCVYMNFTGSGYPATNVVMKNQMAEMGSPDLVTFSTAFRGANSQDENEFALLDTDDDGDLDVLVAALTFGFGEPATTEKHFLNSGVIGPAFLEQVANDLPGAIDATLDLAIVDLNQDGAYDVVSVNGEIPTSSYDTIFYENTGPGDTQPPTVGQLTELAPFVSRSELGQGLVLRTWIQDSVVDDGSTYVQAQVRSRVANKGLQVETVDPMPHIGGQVHRAVVIPQAPAAGMVGATLTLRVEAQDPMGNNATGQEEVTTICGAESYGSGTGLSLIGPDNPQSSGDIVLNVSGGEGGRPGILWRGSAKASITIGGGTLLVDPQGAVRHPFVLDGSGAASLSLPPGVGAMAGDSAFFQAFARSATGAAGMVLSNGVETMLCD